MAKPQATTPSLQLDAQIMSFLGITQQPFTASILSGDAIYTDATRDQMRATLQHHMQFSDLILVVEGDQGSGKTTLFRQLIQNNIPNLFLISMQAEATDTLLQLQQKMVAHLKGQGSANYLDQDLKNLQVFDQFPIAIIDDAHVLSDTTLQELIRYRSQLKHDKQTNLKILLFANPGMAKTLEHISDLQHNQLYVQQMPALTPKQIQAFLDHRLQKAGYRGESLLTPDTIQQIHKKSRGNPGQIMAMAALMIEKHVRNFNRGGGSSITKFLGITVSLMLIAGGIYFWLNYIPATTAPVAIIEPAVEPDMVRDDSLVLSDTNQLTPDSEAAAMPTDGMTSNDPALNTLANIEIPPEPDAAPIDISSSGIAPPESAPATTAPAANTAVTPPPVSVNKPPVAATPLPAPVTEPKPVPPPAAAIEIPTKPAAAPVAKPVIDAAVAQPELAALGIKDSEWLRAQNPAHWTLQLLGARDTQTLVKYVHAHKLGEDCAWYTTQLNGKPWYVLVYRFYTNADSARKGLELLPASMRRGQPWVKSLAAIQKDLPKPHL